VVPAQLAAWAAWRLGGRMGLETMALAWLRFAAFFSVAAAAIWLGIAERLPRTQRHEDTETAFPAKPAPETSLDVVES
jgi:hypothetical protein